MLFLVGLREEFLATSMNSLSRSLDITECILAPDVFRKEEEQSKIRVSHLVPKGGFTETEQVNVLGADAVVPHVSHSQGVDQTRDRTRVSQFSRDVRTQYVSTCC